MPVVEVQVVVELSEGFVVGIGVGVGVGVGVAVEVGVGIGVGVGVEVGEGSVPQPQYSEHEGIQLLSEGHHRSPSEHLKSEFSSPPQSQ